MSDDTFDEDSYLIEHADVLESVIQGHLASGRDHYERYGRLEKRSLRHHPRLGPGISPIDRARAMKEAIQLSEAIPGWCRGAEAKELFSQAYALADDPIIVEIGSFLGSSSVLLGNARRARGSGKIHCVDPFDCSGDSFSKPIYEKLAGNGLRQQFDRNIEEACLSDWVEVHQGAAELVAEYWRDPIDLLFLDGDQSPIGARVAYDAWSRFLKPNGVIAIHNSDPRIYAEDHDGHRRIVVGEIHSPAFGEIRLAATTTFAKKMA